MHRDQYLARRGCGYRGRGGCAYGGTLWGAGIDVFEEEPLPADDPLMKAPHALLTPHAAYWSEEAGLELRTRMTQNAINVVLGREPHDCLNRQVFANGKLKKLSAAK